MKARLACTLAIGLALAACTGPEPAPVGPRLTATEGRAFLLRVIPTSAGDRAGWATDLFAAFGALDVPVTPETLCGAVAVIEQESGFHADPAVPNLPAIAWKEIERQREKLGIPQLLLDAALALPSSDGRSYRARIDAAKTEHDLSNAYEDMIDRVPLGRRLLADRNPVRTAGPMQVSVAFAQAHAERKPYPYPVKKTIREELFSRRGGVYFGVAHLFDYPAPYKDTIFRFADFNAGHYASRNAALQKAIAELSGIPLELDGDLIPHDGHEIGTTERAARTLGGRVAMTPEEIRHDLDLETSPGLERSRFWERVFRMVDAATGTPAPRAVLPQIRLQGPKITRPLTTEWFAKRVAERQRACIARA